MNSRPSRSSSIPIPRSASASSARNIETLITIPLVPPGRHQPRSPSATRPIPEPRRVSGTEGSRASVSTSHGPPTSPIRPSARSATTVSSVPGRSTSNTRFEPRVVRNTVADGERECPPQPSTSPTRTRRASLASVRAAASQRPTIPHHVVARTPTSSFPRPSYLDNSSLRHMLHTEIPIAPIPSRRADPAASARNQAYANALTSMDSEDDSSPGSSPGPSMLPSPNSSFKLPTRWSDQDRHPSLSVSLEGRELLLQGPIATGDKDAASARTTHPIPPACGIFYYEVEILGKEQKSKISIGLSGKTARFAKLPGHEPHSWAYYGDDGTPLSPERTGVYFRQTYGTTDIVGCGIDFTTYKVFFTKNGVLLGQGFENVGKDMPIFPSIGFQQPGDSVRTNFGQEPFKFDIEYHVQQQRTSVWNQIQTTPLRRTILRGHPKTGLGSIASITNDLGDQPPLTEDESKTVLNELVLSYLVHHGYAQTSRAFAKQCQEREITADLETSTLDGDDDVNMANDASKGDGAGSDIETRKTTVNLVLAGEIDTAIDTLSTHYPTVLEADMQLIWLKLRCRKFVELILVTAEFKKKMKAIKEKEKQMRKDALPPAPVHDHWMEDDMGMDIDDDALGPMPLSARPSSNRSDSSGSGREKNLSPEMQEVNGQYEAALSAAFNYGQSLSSNFRSEPRPELQQLFKKTFGIVAWEDPLTEMPDIAGHQPRVDLANEINQAILKSQGRPARPPLETLYRHTATSLAQLGLLGVGSAVFAEMPHESVI